MKIDYLKRCKFSEVPFGEVFTYKDKLFIKAESLFKKPYAVNLGTGLIISDVPDDMEVNKVHVEVMIKCCESTGA